MRIDRREDGAVAITTALVLTVLILLAAFLVDLGGTRADARVDQLLADSSVMAGALTEDTAQQQCEAAVAYYAANVSATPSGAPDCATVFPSGWKCKDTSTWPVSPPIAVYVVGDYTMEITIPVPDSDPAMTVGGQQVTDDDADQCDRMKISVQRTRDYTFGGAAGAGSGGASVNDAVAIRFTPPEPEIFPSLIVLDEKACDVLSSGGGGSDGLVYVENGDLWDHDGDASTPDIFPEGIITVDTTADGTVESYEAASNCGAKRAIIVNGGACIAAEGDIFSFGLAQGAAGNVYSTSDLNANACIDSGSGPQRGLWPEPQGGDPIGRKQIDWRFNCRGSYPEVGDPSIGGTENRYPAAAHATPDRHKPCPEAGDDPGDRPAFIDEIYAKLDGGPAASLGFISTGGGQCPGNIRYDGLTLETSTDGGATWTPISPPPVYVPGRVRIACTVGSNDVLDLRGVRYAYFNSPISASTAELTIHGPNANINAVHDPARTGAVVYFPDSGIERIGDVELLDVFVYVDFGYVQAGDNDELTWQGMVLSLPEVRVGMDSDCADYVVLQTDADDLNDPDLPPPGCFAPLALWSNGVQFNRPHRLGGGGALVVSGTFFTPNAEQVLAGGPSSDFIGSQFYANFLRATGGAQMVMKPSPSSNIPEPPPEPGLIR